VENLRGCSIQISITDRRVLFLFGCVRVHAPSRLSSTAKHKGPSTRRRPRWGRFLGADSKKSLHGRGWCFQWREVWEASSARNLAMLPVGCQFKTAQLNVDVRCSEIPRFRLHRFSPAQVWITQHRGSARRSNGDLGGGVHLCLMDMTALGASHGPVLEAGAGRRNALDRRATLASRAAG
jgi:hypothetical protein